MKTPRGASESSTTSDNTTEFIDIVKKYDVVYNTHNPDYKNVEVKMKVWSQIAEEIGLSVDASKRKWKNLRDSYTKYLRSFRIGTKTSKKYQYWAHADHMDFLKPYQGPGRTSTNTSKPNEEEDTECDLGFQVLTKATTAFEDDIKITITTPPATSSSLSTPSTMMLPTTTAPLSHAMTTATSTATTTTSTTLAHCSLPMTTSTSTTISNTITPTTTGTLMLPMPSLPTVQLPPQFIGKTAGSTLSGPLQGLPSSLATQIFSLPALTNVGKNAIPVPVSSTASSVGCLIIEPQLFASSDTFKKELSAPTTALGLFHSLASQMAPTTTTTAKINQPLITKIRRLPSTPQTSAVNLSFSATPPILQPPLAKLRKMSDIPNRIDLDISSVLQANRDLDANTLFFLSLAKTVRSMPTKFQSLAKMRCMRIVSDIELELENVSDCNGPVNDDNKYTGVDSPPDGSCMAQAPGINDATTEHFVYVMSPSRVESMIDISSEDENTMNGI